MSDPERTMKSVNTTVDQQIALFGQSGSGKTALLCSFYGSAKDTEVAGEPVYALNAREDRHNTLMSMYLGMKEDSKAPPATRFNSRKTTFALKQRNLPLKDAAKADQVCITWHDYPGEWFEGGADSESEKRGRVKTFRNLLESDVALFLVDGQKLRDHEGEEDRYLNYLFSGFIDSLDQIKEDLLQNGDLLKQFPRLWVIGLSKADLWPDMTVNDFENLLNKKAAQHINALRRKLLEFIDEDEHFSFGRDFVLLSSAKFTPGHIDVSQKKGIDVLLPLASVLPVERKLQWHKLKVQPLGLMGKLGDFGVLDTAARFVGKAAAKFGNGGAQQAAAAYAFSVAVTRMTGVAKEALKRHRDQEIKKGDFLTALAAEFTRVLGKAEEERVLVRDNR